MNTPNFQPDDPGFLISRALDGDLTPSEREQLEQALRESPDLRRQADELGAADRLVRRWGHPGVDLDWETHAALTSANAAAQGDVEVLAGVDVLVRRWAEREPGVDLDAFTARVLTKIKEEKRASRMSRVVYRIGLPLAAAAAIAVALVGRDWFAPSRQQVCDVTIRPVARSVAVVDGSRREPTVVVSFAPPVEDAPARAVTSNRGVGVMFIGAESERRVEEGSPL